MKGEPAIVVGAIVAGLNAFLAAGVELGSTAQAIIVAVTAVLGALIVRGQVTPAAALDVDPEANVPGGGPPDGIGNDRGTDQGHAAGA